MTTVFRYYRHAVYMTLMNSFTSVYGGFAVFTTIGFMAHNLNMSVDDVVQSGTAGGYNCSIMNI